VPLRLDDGRTVGGALDLYSTRAERLGLDFLVEIGGEVADPIAPCCSAACHGEPTPTP